MTQSVQVVKAYSEEVHSVCLNFHGNDAIKNAIKALNFYNKQDITLRFSINNDDFIIQFSSQTPITLDTLSQNSPVAVFERKREEYFSVLVPVSIRIYYNFTEKSREIAEKIARGLENENVRCLVEQKDPNREYFIQASAISEQLAIC